MQSTNSGKHVSVMHDAPLLCPAVRSAGAQGEQQRDTAAETVTLHTENIKHNLVETAML